MKKKEFMMCIKLFTCFCQLPYFLVRRKKKKKEKLTLISKTISLEDNTRTKNYNTRLEKLQNQAPDLFFPAVLNMVCFVHGTNIRSLI